MRISPDESCSLFARSPVARLATVSTTGGPHLVPVTFAVIDASGEGSAGSGSPAASAPPTEPHSFRAARPGGRSSGGSESRAASRWPVPSEAGELPSSDLMIVFAVDHKPKSTTSLRRLDNIAANPEVCFLVDHYDDQWERLWWVRADARAVVLDGVHREWALVGLTAKYPQYQDVRPTGVVVGSTVTRWTGWRASDR